MSDAAELTTLNWHTVAPSSLGDLTLVRDEETLRGLYFPHHWYMPGKDFLGVQFDCDFADAVAQLDQYLAGIRRRFDLGLGPQGDAFQQAVWELISQIGYGHTTTYGALAAELAGGVTAQQVGAAVGRNPLCIFIPCHRVVGRGGKLTGYAGGVARKQHLLELEAANVAADGGAALQQTLMTGVW